MLNSKYMSGIIPFVDALRSSCFDYLKQSCNINSLLKEKAKGNNILSLGCGTCNIEINLASSGFSVVAIDSDEQSLKYGVNLSKERGFIPESTFPAPTPINFNPSPIKFIYSTKRALNGGQLNLANGNIFDVPAFRQPFDAIILLNHVFQPAQIMQIAELYRDHLVDDGLFLATWTWSEKSPTSNGHVAQFDILQVGGNACVCFSEYDMADQCLDGIEIYLINPSDPMCKQRSIFIDQTNLIVDCQSTNEVWKVASSFSNWELVFQQSLDAILPTASPPFCRQELIAWRKATREDHR